MINANEVRRLNLVEFEGKVYEIDVIAEEFPTLNTSELGIGVVDWNNINPIDLSDEWLKTLGFDFSASEYEGVIIVKKETRFSAIKTAKFYSIGISGPFGLFMVKVKYVHHLQNLFQSLFQEELTVKN